MNARYVLYITAAICLLGITFLFSSSGPSVMRGIMWMVIAALVGGLARWSLARPFTALFTSFLVMITLVALNTWTAFGTLFSSVQGVYLLAAQLALIYFLTQGLKAAWSADILERELVL